MTSERQHLQNGLADQRQTLNNHQIEQLLAHLNLLREWNKVHNLTAVKCADMLDYHVLDSLSVVPPLQVLLKLLKQQPLNLLDVGSGAGFPGIVLACVFPHLLVDLLESNQKKCRFLTQLKLHLNLANVRVLAQRVEDYQQRYNLIISRATFNPDQLWRRCQHLMSATSYLLAMLSAKQYQQFAEGGEWLPATHRLNWQKLHVPERLGGRYLMCVQKS